MKRITDILRALAFIALLVTGIGFGAYSGQVASYDKPVSGSNVDAIVILTGDAGRLAAGGDLLRHGQANHLLISGVHPSVTTSDIRSYTGLSATEFNCCVTLDREARDTAGNARETADWARSNGFNSMIVVTSDYHLPRSLIEMKKMMPQVELIPYPVETLPPWQNPDVVRLWVQEYAKYATVWVTKLFSGASE